MTPDEDLQFREYSGEYHTLIRAMQRYGITLDRASVRLLEAGIESGAIPTLRRWRNRRGRQMRDCEAIVQVASEGEELSMSTPSRKLLMVYDEGYKAIVTFLPPGDSVSRVFHHQKTIKLDNAGRKAQFKSIQRKMKKQGKG